MNPTQAFTTTAIGRLALAAVFNGPALAHIALPPKAGSTPTRATGSTALPVGSALPQAALYAAIAAGWFGERKKLLDQGLEKDAKAMVRLKDALICGAVLTGVANLVGEQLIKQSYPDGVPVTANGALYSDAPAGLRDYRRYFRAVGTLNRIFVGAAIASTPFINFALFNDYRPNPVRRFFAL